MTQITTSHTRDDQKDETKQNKNRFCKLLWLIYFYFLGVDTNLQLQTMNGQNYLLL